MKLIVAISFLLFCVGRAQLHPGDTIVVDQSGNGEFRTIQQAIDSIPPLKQSWTRIVVKTGLYNEQVEIPKDRQRIILDGEKHGECIIQHDEAGPAGQSSTFKILADNFVARNINFQNMYHRNQHKESPNRQPTQWAPAALIDSDKAAFFNCTFMSPQATLVDVRGRHLFESCTIIGATHTIWGNGQSIYQGCTLIVTAGTLRGPGYITAPVSDSSLSESGFVFKGAQVAGTGRTYLGRAFGKFSSVLFYQSNMSDIVVPEGWDAGAYKGQEASIKFSEVDCHGEGSKQTGRVTWEKQLTPEVVESLVSIRDFIDQDGWLENIPSPP